MASLEQALAVGDGQGSLACCSSPWGYKESDTTEQLNNSSNKVTESENGTEPGFKLVFPSPGDLPNPGIKPRSPTWQAESLPSEPPGSPSVQSFSRVRLFATP